MAETEHDDLGPLDVHTWFGLSYASYLVLDRTVMQALPADTQHRLTALLSEIERLTAGLPAVMYRVQEIDADGRVKSRAFPHYRHAPETIEGLVEAVAGKAG